MRPGAARPDADDVLVLGAGFAGLACALRLKEAGLRCRVLEARQRAGGRVWTLAGCGEPVELGAEFVHGEKVATWRYLQRYGLSGDDRGCSPSPGVSVVEDGGNYVFADGELHPPSSVNGKANRLFFSAIEEASSRWVAQGGDLGISVAELVRQREAEIFASPPTEDERRLCHGMMAEWYGADLEEVAMHEDLPAEELLALAKVEPSILTDDGMEGHWRVREGYSALAERMAEEVDVEYGHEVRAVDWSPDVGGDGTGVAVHVRKASGEDVTLCAAHAVVTVPLACLQAGDVAFSPPLPESKLSAICELGSGTVAKIALRFASKFWPADLQFLFTPFSVQLWWPGSRSAPWLIGYLGGTTDMKLLDLPDQEVLQEAVAQLGRIFADSVPELPALVEGHVVGWHRDAWSKMGYSYMRRGASLSARLRLREQTGNLFWAGEAVHPTKASSVHGALESGEHAARQVLEVLPAREQAL